MKQRALNSLILVVLVAAGAVLAHLHVESQTYYPVVRVATPEGLTYNAVQDGLRDRQACGAANDRFLAPLKQQCKLCKVVYARCERALEGVEAALHDGKIVVLHVVAAPGFRMAIEGPAPGARGLRLSCCGHGETRPAHGRLPLPPQRSEPRGVAGPSGQPWSWSAGWVARSTGCRPRRQHPRWLRPLQPPRRQLLR